jgi:hypothetical protein
MTNDKVRKASQEKSGASDEQMDKGEQTGKVRGRDVDSSFHDYQFQDPETGEDLEVTQVVHDVPTGVGKDGSVETGKATDEYVQPAKDSKGSKANQGEGGERSTRSTKS